MMRWTLRLLPLLVLSPSAAFAAEGAATGPVYFKQADEHGPALEGHTCYALAPLTEEPKCGYATCLAKDPPDTTIWVELKKGGEARAVAMCGTRYSNLKWKTTEDGIELSGLISSGMTIDPADELERKKWEPIAEDIPNISYYSDGQAIVMFSNRKPPHRAQQFCSVVPRRAGRMVWYCSRKKVPSGEMPIHTKAMLTLVDAGAGQQRVSEVGRYVAEAWARHLGYEQPESVVLLAGEKSKARRGITVYYRDMDDKDLVEKIVKNLHARLPAELPNLKRRFWKKAPVPLMVAVGAP